MAASRAMVGEETGGDAVNLGAFLTGAKKLLADRRCRITGGTVGGMRRWGCPFVSCPDTPRAWDPRSLQPVLNSALYIETKCHKSRGVAIDPPLSRSQNKINNQSWLPQPTLSRDSCSQVSRMQQGGTAGGAASAGQGGQETPAAGAGQPGPR